MVWIDSGHLLPLIADGRIFNLSHNLWHTGVSCRCLAWTIQPDDGLARFRRLLGRRAELAAGNAVCKLYLRILPCKKNHMSPCTPGSTGPAISYACTVPSCLLKEQSAPSQHDLRPFGKSGMWKHRVSAFRHGRLFFAVLRSRGRRRGASSTSVGTGSSFFRLRVTRATACLGDRIDSCRFFWRHLRSDNRVRGSRSAVLPRCSIFSRCSRVDRSTLDWF